MGASRIPTPEGGDNTTLSTRLFADRANFRSNQRNMHRSLQSRRRQVQRPNMLVAMPRASFEWPQGGLPTSPRRVELGRWHKLYRTSYDRCARSCLRGVGEGRYDSHASHKLPPSPPANPAPAQRPELLSKPSSSMRARISKREPRNGESFDNPGIKLGRPNKPLVAPCGHRSLASPKPHCRATQASTPTNPLTPCRAGNGLRLGERRRNGTYADPTAPRLPPASARCGVRIPGPTPRHPDLFRHISLLAP